MLSSVAACGAAPARRRRPAAGRRRRADTTINFESGESADYDGVVWATGFRIDHSWIDLPEVKDERGELRACPWRHRFTRPLSTRDDLAVHHGPRRCLAGLAMTPPTWLIGSECRAIQGRRAMHTHHEVNFSTDTEGLDEAKSPEVIRLRDGETHAIEIKPVRKHIGDAEVRMLGYNGSIPGPTLHVDQNSEVTVEATNLGDVDATLHWHGLRLENRFDGVPEETQAPIPHGGKFTYRLQFPDPGFYWYHPHIREDFAQEMGLYAGIIVEPDGPGLLAASGSTAGDHPRRHPDRGRADRAVRPLRADLHRHGPLRQRDADQRRDRLPGRGQGRGGCAAASWSTRPTRGSSTSRSAARG